jgi:hypothetical protein
MDLSDNSLSDAVRKDCAQQFHAQVNRLLQSASFRDTPASRRLLEYIAEHSLEGSPETLKEFTIGVEALGRRMDFDPKADTIVRVQIRRLRQRINQYYETEGVDDPVVITIPKGSYAAEFFVRAPEILLAAETETEQGISEFSTPIDPFILPTDQARLPVPANLHTVPEKPPRVFRSWVVFMIFLSLVCGGLTGYWFARRVQSRPVSTPIEQLWSAMLKGDDSPIIGYPDGVFLVDGSSNMFQFTDGPLGTRGELVDPNIARRFTLNPALIASAGPLYYENGGYTGTGEIESVAVLSVLLNKLGFKPKVLRSHDITVDDLRNHNVILLGGSAQNKAVKDYLTQGDFEYDYTPRAWGGRIVSRHPLKGEAAVYQVERNPLTHAIDGDYALISCLPGVDRTHRVITLGGLDTTGTLGATLYATSAEGAEKIAGSLNKAYESPYFQSIVHVQLIHGNQVLNVAPKAMHSR